MNNIKGYEGLYSITSCGRVYSHYTKKFLKPMQCNGYLRICLVKDGIKKSFLIHRLVAEAYLDNPNNLPQVNHKDENPMHNWINNLEWCDSKYNLNYGSRREKAAQSKSKQVICLKTGIVYDNAKQAAEILGKHPETIRRACRKGESWKYT